MHATVLGRIINYNIRAVRGFFDLGRVHTTILLRFLIIARARRKKKKKIIRTFLYCNYNNARGREKSARLSPGQRRVIIEPNNKFKKRKKKFINAHEIHSPTRPDMIESDRLQSKSEKIFYLHRNTVIFTGIAGLFRDRLRVFHSVSLKSLIYPSSAHFGPGFFQDSYILFPLPRHIVLPPARSSRCHSCVIRKGLLHVFLTRHLQSLA